MPWNDLANNQTVSFTNLKDAVDLGYFSPKGSIPVSNEQTTKDDVNIYVYVNTSFTPFASKSGNQLVVKSNLECGTPVINTQDLLWTGIANNETTSSPIQLLAGYGPSGPGKVYRSTDYGQSYSSVLSSGPFLTSVKYMPAFRHASYLSVIPFLAVGATGRIITNSNNDATSWIAITSPSTQNLYDIAYNNIGTAIIVGDRRILKTNTNNRINSWSIINSVASVWRSAASDGIRFVVVGEDSSIIVGTSSGTVWTAGTMPPLAPLNIELRGVTYHTDSFWYAVGVTSGGAPYIMKSIDSLGFDWENYTTTGDSFIGPLFSISSINGRLVVGGFDYQYQIIGNSVRRCGANTGGISMQWDAIVKNANSSNGFDMAGVGIGNIGGYSNF
jgi:hypothetical protein